MDGRAVYGPQHLLGVVVYRHLKNPHAHLEYGRDRRPFPRAVCHLSVVGSYVEHCHVTRLFSKTAPY